MPAAHTRRPCCAEAWKGDDVSWDEEEDTRTYKVVINHEEQYSIWPVDRENPLGWNDVGKSGTKQECLDYIEEVWTDMRPLSLRKKMEEMEKQARQEGN
jgi:MbtH protein